MRDISIISQKLIVQSYFESKLDKEKYNKDKYYNPSYKACDDICYIYYDNVFFEKGTDDYKEYCAGFCDIVNESEENAWKKVVFPWDDFYESIGIEYHYELDILKDLLLPFIDEDWYVVTNCADIVPIKEFVLNYNKLD